MPTHEKTPPMFLSMIYEAFKVCSHLIAIATVCASTKNNEARRALHGLFLMR